MYDQHVELKINAKSISYYHFFSLATTSQNTFLPEGTTMAYNRHLKKISFQTYANKKKKHAIFLQYYTGNYAFG